MAVGLVIFDLDGTLVDSMGVYAEKAGELINKHYGVSVDTAKELYLKTSGLPFLHQLELLFPGDERNQKVARAFEEWKGEVIKDLFIDRDALLVLRELRRMGYRTAVSSNNLQEYVEEIVARSGAKLDFVLGWDGGDFKKGESHVRFLERQTSLSRDSFLMVGDSPNDLKLAKSCGVRFVALLRSFPEESFTALDPDVITIKSIVELPSLLENRPDLLKDSHPVLPS